MVFVTINVLFSDEIFGSFNSFISPFVWSEIFEFQTRMENQVFLSTSVSEN